MYVGDFLDAELAKKRGVGKEICETCIDLPHLRETICKL